MQNEKDKKMTEYFKSKNFLEKFLCLMIELNEKERLHMPTWEDQTVLLRFATKYAWVLTWDPKVHKTDPYIDYFV